MVALGGNALLQARRTHDRRAPAGQRPGRGAGALARVAKDHELIVSHGNGPQVGLLALQGEAYKEVEAYPLDILGAETQGMIGYMLEQELGNQLPFEVPLATVLTMVEVDPDDPAFEDPTKFVGPIYDEAKAKRLAAEKGWSVKPDGQYWRRVVPSPWPQADLRDAANPVAAGARHGRDLCRGRGHADDVRAATRSASSIGVEAVIDKDLATSLLARELDADLFVMATDVDGVYADLGQPTQRRMARIDAGRDQSMNFAAGSMGPKVGAAVEFAEATGKRAAIGSLDEIERLVVGHLRHEYCHRHATDAEGGKPWLHSGSIPKSASCGR